jgi:hypothetical protein
MEDTGHGLLQVFGIKRSKAFVENNEISPLQ